MNICPRCDRPMHLKCDCAAGSSPAGEVPPMVPSPLQRVAVIIDQYHDAHGVLCIEALAGAMRIAHAEGYTAAAARLRNPSEDDVERIRDALEKSMGKPRGTVDMDRHARAALLAAAEMMEGK